MVKIKDNRGFAWGQMIFPAAVLIGQVLSELIIRPLFNRNVQAGMEAAFIIMYIFGNLFFIFITYYLISIVVSEWS